jgi:hypothetical protein
VTGTLKKARVGERGVDRYYADVEYAYRVGGDEFIGSRVRASDVEYNVRDGVAQAIGGLAVDKPVPVYYDPADPRRAVLRPGAGFQDYALLFIPVLMLGAGVGGFWSLWRTR